jgi:hypothetical protein
VRSGWEKAVDRPPPNTRDFVVPQTNGIKFPLPHRVGKVPKAYKTTCAALPSTSLHTRPPSMRGPCLTQLPATPHDRSCMTHPHSSSSLINLGRSQVHDAEADHFLLIVLVAQRVGIDCCAHAAPVRCTLSGYDRQSYLSYLTKILFKKPSMTSSAIDSG